MQPTISTMPVVTALLVFVAAAVFAANTPLFGATDAIDASEVQILQSGRVFAHAKGCLTIYGQGFQSKASHEIHSAFDQTKGHHKRHQ
jgi:hypothetical protein